MWAYTVKDNRKEVTDYRKFFEVLKKKGCDVLTKYPEYGQTNRLHYHGVVMIPEKVHRKSLAIDGLHFHLDEIFDRAGWDKYCRKEVLSEDDGTEVPREHYVQPPVLRLF